MLTKMISLYGAGTITARSLVERIQNKEIHLVIFDCDGVLAVTEPFHVQARKIALEKMFGPISLTEKDIYRLSKGLHNEDGMLILLLNAPETHERFALLENIPGSTSLDSPGITEEQRSLLSIVKELSLDKLEDFCVLMRTEPLAELPGLRQFLETLYRSGARTALASANEDAYEVVRSLGLQQYFDEERVFTGHQLGTYGEHIRRIMRTKQDLFEELMLMEGCILEQVIGFEDSPGGITAFQELGITAVGIDTADTGEVDHADLVVRSFKGFI